MTIQKPGRGSSGFTLIEMLVVLALLMILVLLGMPQLFTAMRQAKLRGIAQETVALMRQARLDAVKYSAQSVVRIVLPSGGQLGRVEAFSDRDSNGRLNAATEPVLGRVELPAGISFLAPPGVTDKDSVDGLTVDPESADLPHIAIFRGDGTVTDVGAFRFGDQAKNFVEVRMDAVTARIEILKCRSCTDATDRSDWYASGDGGEAWKWN